jgi:hypothetical protein
VHNESLGAAAAAALNGHGESGEHEVGLERLGEPQPKTRRLNASMTAAR